MKYGGYAGTGITGRRWCVLAVLTVASGMPMQAQTDLASSRADNAVIHVHDPHIIRAHGRFYVFSTGPGIPIRRSDDLVHWEIAGQVFLDPVPAWAKAEIPEATGIWAPDITFRNGRYWLYYSVSTFGKNRSVIGLATNKTLDARHKDYRWVDHGKVWESRSTDDFNAIDPSAISGPGNHAALVFGSFWSGIKMVDIDPKTGKPVKDTPVRSIASRPGSAIEAACLVRRGQYYYHFLSFDLCCRGANSTYNIRVGRAPKMEGPYLDKDGKSMMEGGGTMLLQNDGRFAGPGHCSVARVDDAFFLAYHGYDREANGVPTLRIRRLNWDAEGWPILGEPVVAADK